MFTSGPQSLAWCPQATDTLRMTKDGGRCGLSLTGTERSREKSEPELVQSGRQERPSPSGSGVSELSSNTDKSGEEAGREGALDEGNTAHDKALRSFWRPEKDSPLGGQS